MMGAEWFRWRFLLTLAWLVGAMAIAPVLTAQVPEPIIDAATVESALAEMEADDRLEDAVKELLRPVYLDALASAKAAADFVAATGTYRETLISGAARTAGLRAQLEQSPSEAAISPVPVDASSEELQMTLESSQSALEELNDEQAEVEDRLKRLKDRPIEISNRISEVKSELAAVEHLLLSTMPAEDLSSPGRTAERIEIAARRQRLVNELEMLKQEQLSQSVREDLLRAQRDLLDRQIEISTASVDRLAAAVNERLALEAQEVTSIADRSILEIADTDQAGRDLANEVQQLAGEFEEVVNSVQVVASIHREVKVQLQNLTWDFDFAREYLELRGHSEAIAEVLFDLLKQLPGLGIRTVDEERLEKLLNEARLGALRVEEKLRSHPGVEALFADQPSRNIEELLRTRHEVLSKLGSQYRNMIRSLAALHGDELEFASKVEDARRFAFDKLFNVRSSPPIAWATARDLPGDIQWLFSSKQWSRLFHSLVQVRAKTPFLFGMSIILVAILFLIRRPLVRIVAETGSAARRISTASYASSIQSLLASVLLALPLALIPALTAYAIIREPDQTDWSAGFGPGLEIFAWLTFSAAFLSSICRSQGLAVAHFGWRPETARLLGRTIVRFVILVGPLYLVTIWTVYADGGRHLNSLGRFSFMLVQMWTGYLTWLLFRSTGGSTDPSIPNEPASMIGRYRKICLVALIGIPTVLMILAATGYLVTAIQLSLGYLTSMALVAGGVLLYWLTLRWFTIKERKLALADAVEQRSSQLEHVDPARDGADAGEVVPADPEPELGLDSISEQTRHLLRFVFSMGVVLALGFLWSETIPVFNSLDTIDLVGQLSLLQAVQALLIVLLAYSVVRNLPGLMELGGLRFTNLEIGTRVAITTLSQYTVTAVAIIAVFHVLNLDFSRLGWVIAALSVGLGFGLQEVVLNFVCGLILLFERPIRVGDIVTVDGTTGTVTSIHMRATTLINWDRKEYVVPNKTFVTGAFLNWTLSSQINRTIITVGVAYGSDTSEARQILVDTALNHPNVLKDPQPVATFEEFGESALRLRLRVFLPGLDNRLQIISDLHTEINRRLSEAGIDIAYPQQDVHIRDWKRPTAPLAERS